LQLSVFIDRLKDLKRMTSNEKVVPVNRIFVIDKIVPSARSIKKLHAVPIRAFLEHGVVEESAIALQVNGGLTCLTTIASCGAPFAVVVLDFIVDANFACFLHTVRVPPDRISPWIGEAQLSMILKLLENHTPNHGFSLNTTC
jgi:hypothetical protein